MRVAIRRERESTSPRASSACARTKAAEIRRSRRPRDPRQGRHRLEVGVLERPGVRAASTAYAGTCSVIGCRARAGIRLAPRRTARDTCAICARLVNVAALPGSSGSARFSAASAGSNCSAYWQSTAYAFRSAGAGRSPGQNPVKRVDRFALMALLEIRPGEVPPGVDRLGDLPSAHDPAVSRRGSPVAQARQGLAPERVDALVLGGLVCHGIQGRYRRIEPARRDMQTGELERRLECGRLQLAGARPRLDRALIVPLLPGDVPGPLPGSDVAGLPRQDRPELGERRPVGAGRAQRLDQVEPESGLARLQLHRPLEVGGALDRRRRRGPSPGPRRLLASASSGSIASAAWYQARAWSGCPAL